MRKAMVYDASNTAFFCFTHYFSKFKIPFNQMLKFLPEAVNWLFFLLIRHGKAKNAASVYLVSYFPELEF